jgi:hypothetical protein
LTDWLLSLSIGNIAKRFCCSSVVMFKISLFWIETFFSICACIDLWLFFTHSFISTIQEN